MSKSSISEALITEAKRENSQYYSSKPGRPRNHSPTRFSPPEALGYVAMGECALPDLQFKPHKKNLR